MCGYSNVTGTWVSGYYSMSQKYKKKIGRIQKTLHSRWKKKVAYPVTEIDDFVKQIFWEHKSGGRPLDELGRGRPEEYHCLKRETIQNTGRRYAGSGTAAKRQMVEVYCGVVIKGVDRKWMRVSKFAVPSKVCTAMAAEVVGASVLTGTTWCWGKPSVWTPTTDVSTTS